MKSSDEDANDVWLTASVKAEREGIYDADSDSESAARSGNESDVGSPTIAVVQLVFFACTGTPLHLFTRLNASIQRSCSYRCALS
jgi:hypothetical protein